MTRLFSAVGMLWKIFLILSFVILSSFTCMIPILSILRMLLCQKTSSLVMWERRSAHDSHPQSSRFPGIAMKICCLAFRSAYGLFHTCLRAPIALLAVAIRWLMSKSSVRSKDIWLPRYLKCLTKSMNPSATFIRLVS